MAQTTGSPEAPGAHALPLDQTSKSGERVRSAVVRKLTSKRSVDVAASMAYGKSLRKVVARADQGTFVPAANRPDPVELLKEQGASRVQELLPLRYERMSPSAFTFYRGAALIMAQDLSTQPLTGISVQLCGDAHVSNFGFFASPERHLIFDLNDFDETSRGPWEWDVKRLVASLEICGLNRGFSEADRNRVVLGAARAYRHAMLEFAEMGNTEVYYDHIEAVDLGIGEGNNNLVELGGVNGHTVDLTELGLSEDDVKALSKTLQKAQEKNSALAVAKLTEVVDGELRIISNPPTLVPLRDNDPNDLERMKQVFGNADMAEFVRMILSQYLETLEPSRRFLVEQYHGVDIGSKVVGVGSVGTRAWIVVMEGSGANDPLVLQIKEAQESVLERFCGRAPQAGHGRRVVEGQRAIQAASDPLLGWCSLPDTEGGVRDYYVRQLWDGKGSMNLDTISLASLCVVADACGWTLAHAHARTGDRFALAAYLGKGDSFDKAMVSFARAYAKQNEADYQRFMAARAAGEL